MNKEWKSFRDAPEDKPLLWWIPVGLPDYESGYLVEYKPDMFYLQKQYEQDGLVVNLEDWVWKHLPPQPKTKKDNK